MVKHDYRSIMFGILLFASLLLTTMVSAKGPDLLHVLGTVAVIDLKHIEVKPAKGPVVSVLLNKQVKYKNKNNPKSIDPPTVGDHVIIEASKDDKTKKVTATVVHYSPIRNAPPPR
jgi:hypothetical protein